MMGKSLTAEKSFGFAIRIVRLYKILYERKEFVLSKQMLRSGTAIGALLKEAEHAQSKADFISKVNIALKEANETEYWIMLLKETDYLSEKEYESIIEDCRELIKLTVSIVKTSKQNMNGTSKYLLVPFIFCLLVFTILTVSLINSRQSSIIDSYSFSDK